MNKMNDMQTQSASGQDSLVTMMVAFAVLALIGAVWEFGTFAFTGALLACIGALTMVVTLVQMTLVQFCPGKESTYFCAVGEKLTPDDGLIKRFTMTKDLADLIVFMVSGYIRPTDVRNMQHKHVEVVKREWTYLRLTLPPSKGHSFPTTTMPWAVKVYERICRRQEIEFGRPVGPEDYVFMPHSGTRDSAIKSLAKQFDIVLALTGLKISNVGEPRSLYSLRHSSIMFRLMFGRAVDTLTLARNARTSPEMIDRFYAAPLQGEMNVGELQSKRRPRPWELGQAK
jgi:hypothetical protein